MADHPHVYLLSRKLPNVNIGDTVAQERIKNSVSLCFADIFFLTNIANSDIIQHHRAR